MPFLHLHIDATGTCKACCIANINLGNIKNSSVKEIWEGKAIQKLRQNFLEGKKDNRCQNCYSKEEAGNESLRTETLKKYGHLKEEFIISPKPVYADIRFSNLCSLKCRTCWHGNSSKWFEDAKKLKRKAGEKALIKAFSDTTKLQEELFPILPDLKEFYFAGGEPFLMEEHIDCLNELIAKKNFECLLRYNSNLMSLHQFDTDLIQKWNSFKRIEILASIDALGNQGQIIRSGFDEELFISNFKRIKKTKNIHIKIAPTLSILNAKTLAQLHKKLVNENLIEINDVHFNILHQPFFYNVKAFPSGEKIKIRAHFKTHIDWIQKNGGNPEDWKNAINYMMSEDLSHKYQKTMHETKLLNDLRNEQLSLEN